MKYLMYMDKQDADFHGQLLCCLAVICRISHVISYLPFVYIRNTWKKQEAYFDGYFYYPVKFVIICFYILKVM